MEKKLHDLYEECEKICCETEDQNLKNRFVKLSKFNNNLKNGFNRSDYLEFRSIVYEIEFNDFMKKMGFKINATSDKFQPDFLIDELCYIECILSTEGTGIQLIDVTKQEGIGTATTDDLGWGLSRLTNSFDTKAEKYKNYLATNVIRNDLPLIIAIDASIISEKTFSPIVLENMRRALYGIGDLIFEDKSSKMVLSKLRVFEPKVSKGENNEFEGNYFNREEYRQISGVIINQYPFMFDDRNILFINPLANIGIDLGRFKNKINCYGRVKIEPGLISTFDYLSTD